MPGEQIDKRRSPLRRWPWQIGLLAGVLYFTLVGVLAGIEYSSEMHKLDRGAYTDTFPPLAFTGLVTLPLSAVFDVPYYPVEINIAVYRGVVRDRATAFLEAGALQAVILAGGVGGILALRRRAEDST